MTNPYEVLALRVGVWQTTRGHQFYRYGSYGEPDGALQLDYFFWVIRNSETTILVDTGFHPEAAKKRLGRVCFRAAAEALSELGIAASDVSRVIVSHFHYDHIGNVSSFPNARITMQKRELEFWTSADAAFPPIMASAETDEIRFLQEAVSQGRVDFIDGDAEIAPGITAELVGGHCPGQQIIIIDGVRPIVLATDALHFYEEMERDMPFECFVNLSEMYRTFALLRKYENERNAIVVAGHDPEVMNRFEVVSIGGEPHAVRITP